MAEQIMLKKGSLTKKSYVGFSWTVFFFSFFVPLFRGDWKWALIMFGLELLPSILLPVLGIGTINLILSFLYNRFYTRSFLEKGWEPIDEETKQLLIDKGYID